MAYVWTKLRLADFDIAQVRLKRAITGALIIEIPGEDSDTKTDRLCAAMFPLVEEKRATITRPVKTSELRVRGR